MGKGNDFDFLDEGKEAAAPTTKDVTDTVELTSKSTETDNAEPTEKEKVAALRKGLTTGARLGTVADFKDAESFSAYEKDLLGLKAILGDELSKKALAALAERHAGATVYKRVSGGKKAEVSKIPEQIKINELQTAVNKFVQSALESAEGKALIAAHDEYVVELGYPKADVPSYTDYFLGNKGLKAFVKKNFDEVEASAKS